MDFISNLITTITNGEKAHLLCVIYNVPSSSYPKKVVKILTILRDAGKIRAFSFTINKLESKFSIYLKYTSFGSSSLSTISCVSKPSRKFYISTKALWQPQTATGFFVLSTIYGIITDFEARYYNVGGVLLFSVT